jgi:malate/lactate dehydrogenase
VITKVKISFFFSKIANRLGVPVNNVNKVTIWGNHSSTQFPDVANATVVTANGETKSVADAINDQAWLNGDFISVSVFHFLYFILFFTINIPMSDG